MDIKEISRNKYNNIPTGGSLFTIDKIGLRIPTKYINKNNIKQWKTSNTITILTFGETSQINIHAEFELWEEHLGKKCFDAICLLLLDGVFNIDFTLPFMEYFQILLPIIIFDKSYYVFLLSNFFEIAEWEWAWDFMDKPLYSFLDIDMNNKNNFKNYKNSNYSKDGKVTKRTKERNGEKVSLSKGRQQSLVNLYDNGEKIKSNRMITRAEIRQQGKYKKDLAFDYLDGTKKEAINKAIPVLKKSVNKVIHPKAVELTEYWKKNAPQEFTQIFSVNN